MTKTRQIGLAAAVIVAIGLVGLYWLSVNHSWSAREKPSALEAYVARHLRRLATPSHIRELANPLEPTELSIAQGRDHFADHCAICHANDGSGDTQIGANMYPPAPDMRREPSRSLSDGEIFYIIKNGIRFTGMPGWGGDDEENWKLVLFVRHLPDLTNFEMELMNEINGLGDRTTRPHSH